MALVMLPCDLPWWSNVMKKLQCIQECKDVEHVIDIMQKIHDLCNVSLDPDEDQKDPTIFNGLRNFLNSDLNLAERQHFISVTLQNLAKRALSLRSYRPPRGLTFSLQQQADAVDISYNLCAALLANAFFSTFPKRTDKTHPTLQDFNFTYFFKNLNSNTQKAKLKCILYYFDWIELNNNVDDHMKVCRKVMNGRQWLTIEDWQECGLPLCSLDIKHERKIESTSPDIVQTIFSSSKPGGRVLSEGNSQECFHFTTFPEILSVLLFAETIEDNEAIYIENCRQFTRIIGSNNKAVIETLDEPRKISVILMDAENYSNFPVNQFEEDNILRELNKCLLAFRQNLSNTFLNTCEQPKQSSLQRRLSPIGEGSTNVPKEMSTTIVIRQASSSTKRSSYDSEKLGNDIAGRRSWLCTTPVSKTDTPVLGPTTPPRRGRFIVLGSSGECLPVNRAQMLSGSNSVYSSCDSGSEDYFSAKASLDNENDCDEEMCIYTNKNEIDKRYTFAEKLRAALRQSDSLYDGSTDSNYAVDISISGSKNGDEGIRVRRGRSTGFVLTEDSDHDYNYTGARFRQKCDNSRLIENGNGNSETDSSSLYSFSTDCSSEELSKWLGDQILKSEDVDPRDEAVIHFASSLLKRTLSESFVGVPLTEGCASSINAEVEENANNQNNNQNKMKLNARSLSLELAKHKHRIAAQLTSNCMHNSTPSLKTLPKQQAMWYISGIKSLQTINCDEVTVKISQIRSKRLGVGGVKPVATGNWGCGNTLNGNVQLKLIIQWMAASLSGIPYLTYYTAGHEQLSKLDTLCRVLLDRKWTVGELTSAILTHAKDILNTPLDPRDDQCIFEKLLGL